MAIEFVVETGTGNIDATSYVSLDDADQYALNVGSSTWDDYSDDQKKAYLNVATSAIDDLYEYDGYTANDDNQALKFPRDLCLDKQTREYLASDEIPQALQKATVELAFIQAATGNLILASAGESFKLEKVGGLEIERFYSSKTAKQPTFLKAEYLVKRYFKDNDGDLIRA